MGRKPAPGPIRVVGGGSVPGHSRLGQARLARTSALLWLLAFSHVHAEPTKLSLTISGGVSLGAYQAGFLHYLTKVIKRNPDQWELRVVTGASAGTINGLLSILSVCEDTVDDPEQSLFWKVWIPIGFDKLFQPDEVSATGVFTRRAFENAAQLILETLAHTGSRHCDVLLGASATRLHPVDENRNNRGLRIPRMREHFVVRIWKENGSLRMANAGSVEHLALVLAEGETQQRDTLIRLLYASSAFPGAFAPIKLRYSVNGKTEEADFIDGGVFDNEPLHLAQKLAAPNVKEFLYLDPENTGQAAHTPPNQYVSGLLPLAKTLASGFVRTARANELRLFQQAAANRGPVLTQRQQPTLGSHLAAFFGFFDEAFRRFDFYLGVRDAKRFVELHMKDAVNKPPVDARPLACLESVFSDTDRDLTLPSRCGESDGRDWDRAYRVLLQVTLDRSQDEAAPNSSACDLGHGRRIKGVEAAGWTAFKARATQSVSRSDSFSCTMYRLAAYGFHFTDLDLPQNGSWRAMAEMKNNLFQAIDAAAAAQQDTADAAMLRLTAKPAVNFLSYAPTDLIAYVGLGQSGEVGVSKALWLPVYRWDMAVQVRGWNTWVTSDANALVAVTPLVGFEAEPTFLLSNPYVQVRFGGRVGYQFTNKDAGGTADACGANAGDCSGFAAQALVVLSVFERLRVQAALERIFEKADRGNVKVLLSAGFQFLSPLF